MFKHLLCGKACYELKGVLVRNIETSVDGENPMKIWGASQTLDILSEASFLYCGLAKSRKNFLKVKLAFYYVIEVRR